MITNRANLSAKNKVGSTPLHSAVLSGRKDVVNTLISSGADVNVKNYNGNTPLHEAAFLGENENVKILITGGADINGNIISLNEKILKKHLH